MNLAFHLLRPWWFLAFVPFAVLFWRLQRCNLSLQSWAKICDQHLLKHLMQPSTDNKYNRALLLLFISGFCVILSLTGPCFSKHMVPAYQSMQVRVVILDMSDAMLAQDLLPNRLVRVKFKLHELFTTMDGGQMAFVVFTSEPFVISPLTNDAKTIDALLTSVTPDIMPVGGYRLDLALKEAAKLIQQTGFERGQILVLTANAPNSDDLDIARNLSKTGINISVMPIVAINTNKMFALLATAGQGELLSLVDNDNLQS